MTKTDAQLTADILLDIEAIHIRPDEPFVHLRPKSPVYVDCRKIISFRGRGKMAMATDLMARAVGPEAFDAVAGGETAGIPYAAYLSDLMALPMLYVRKKLKGFGRNAQSRDKRVSRYFWSRTWQRTAAANSPSSTVCGKGRGAHCFVIFHYGIF